MEFLKPKNLSEALAMVGENPTYRILAGGTDLCVAINSGAVGPAGIVCLWGIAELSKIKETNDSIEIGALVTHTKINNCPSVQFYLPSLAEACKTIGAKQIQNRGTIGGNVMNASPAGDTLPVLLAYNAKVVAAGSQKTRILEFADFYKGYRKTSLSQGEIITKFIIPKTSGEKSAFMKVGTRKAQAISKVMGCFRLKQEDGIIKSAAIAFGSVAPIPLRIKQAEEALVGRTLSADLIVKIKEIVASEVQPINDIRSTANYRRHVCGVLIKRFLESL